MITKKKKLKKNKWGLAHSLSSMYASDMTLLIKEWSEGYRVKSYRHDDDTTDWGGIEKKNVTMITLSMHVIFTLQEFDSNIYIIQSCIIYDLRCSTRIQSQCDFHWKERGACFDWLCVWQFEAHIMHYGIPMPLKGLSSSYFSFWNGLRYAYKVILQIVYEALN